MALVSLFLTALAATIARPAMADEPDGDEFTRYVYSVKFMCYDHRAAIHEYAGRYGGGAYKSTISLQRLSMVDSTTVGLKASTSRTLNGSAQEGALRSETLTGSEVLELVCADLGKLVDSPGATYPIAGNLLITSTEPLSVIGVYNAKHCNQPIDTWTRGQACSGEIALDVEHYEPVLVQGMSAAEDDGLI